MIDAPAPMQDDLLEELSLANTHSAEITE
jgi:hypothetical protein